MPITVEEYKQRLAARIVEEMPNLNDFRTCWIHPQDRSAFMKRLPDQGRSAQVVQSLDNMTDYDLYDILAELGYGLAPKTRMHRADAFFYKHDQWLNSLPTPTADTLKALTMQFARTGTDGLENPRVFATPEVTHAGGINALARDRTACGFADKNKGKDICLMSGNAVNYVNADSLQTRKPT